MFKQGEIGEDEAKRRAIEELRAMRYANDEYLFIDDHRGYSLLLPFRPELEGTRVLLEEFRHRRCHPLLFRIKRDRLPG